MRDQSQTFAFLFLEPIVLEGITCPEKSLLTFLAGSVKQIDFGVISFLHDEAHQQRHQTSHVQLSILERDRLHDFSDATHAHSRSKGPDHFDNPEERTHITLGHRIVSRVLDERFCSLVDIWGAESAKVAEN